MIASAHPGPWRARAGACLVAALASACSGDARPTGSTAPSTPAVATAATGPSTPAAGAPRPTVVILGDSLTAGLGLDVTHAYPALLQARLDREGYDYEVVNAGVSGDTSAGGLRRLAWSLDARARVLIVALGANDGLRGLAPVELEKNLGAIVDRGLKAGVTVIVAGMEAPPNNGPEYTAAFRQVYPGLARTRHVALIPFLLDGVAGVASLNQPDGIHPNERGAAIVAETVWRTLQPALRKPAASTP